MRPWSLGDGFDRDHKARWAKLVDGLFKLRPRWNVDVDRVRVLDHRREVSTTAGVNDGLEDPRVAPAPRSILTSKLPGLDRYLMGEVEAIRTRR